MIACFKPSADQFLNIEKMQHISGQMQKDTLDE